MEILSRKEAISKDLAHYFTGIPCKYGHVDERNIYGQCMECNRLKINTGQYKGGRKAYRHKRRKENREAILARENAYREANPERVLEWNQTQREKNQAPEKRRIKSEKAMEWARANRGKKNAIVAARRAALRNNMPAWADREAIKFFYECRPAGCHVDHIIPLQGKNISGLHVAENLQWLPATDNLQKSNKWN